MKLRALAAAATAKASAQQSKAGSLTDWIRSFSPQQPASLGPQPLPSRGGGWGLVTAQPVQAGQQLVVIPREATMSAASAAGCPLLAPVLAQGLTDWQALSLHLLTERAKGPDSFWAPYIALLPNQADHPLLWGPQQHAWLEGSPMAQTLANRLEQILEDTEAVEEAVRRAGSKAGASATVGASGQGLGRLVSVRSMAWAAATALSRGFNLGNTYFLDDSEDDDDVWDDVTTLLVPWADMLNHSSEAGQESCLRSHGETASLRAHRDYAAGEEVFDSYGPWQSPQELLLNYGFFDPANANSEATLLFDPAAVAGQGFGGKDAAGFGGGSMDMVVGPDGPDETALTWVRAVVTGNEALFAHGWDPETGVAGDLDPEQARALGALSEPTDRAAEAAILDALLAAHDVQLKGYPTSADEDAAIAANAATSWLERQVRLTLASEKRALAGSRETVARWRSALSAGVELNRLYSCD